LLRIREQPVRGVKPKKATAGVINTQRNRYSEKNKQTTEERKKGVGFCRPQRGEGNWGVNNEKA